jgi:hypothetical protein
LDDSMVSTHDGGVDADATLQIGHSSPPPTMTQVITSIRELRYEQTKLLPHLVTNSSCHIYLSAMVEIKHEALM